MLVLLGVTCVGFGFAQAPSQTTATAETRNAGELLKKLDLLIEQNARLEEQNRALMEQIQSLRKGVADQAGLKADRPQQDTSNLASPTPIAEIPDETEEVVEKTEPKRWGNYTPNFGYKVVDTEKGDMSISIYTYARYLNQRALDDTFTDAFGNIKKIQQRQDFQLNKVQIKFLGWVMSPKFRYFLYGWTNNATQGLPAQVVLAGNLNYSFNDHLALSAGITSLPGTRSVEGNFPFWLGVDARMIADEFFRPSYTSGIWAKGQISKKLRYQAMVGNNLSTLGVSAAQLDKGFNTFAGALVWTPTTGEFGPGFGDFEDHQELATRLAVHFTRSNEDKQSQPNSESFENTQLRLSDGSIIFNPNLFGPGITITDARYRMSTADGGVKYHGLALEGEYFWRWLDDFKGTGTATVPDLFDHGFQMQLSAMVVPKTLQLYAGHSRIFGQFGHPYDARFGGNWFPWKNKVIRWNTEVLYLSRSPVGYTAVPFPAGGNGFVFHSTLELAF
jgi:hypothetical protein